MIPEKASHLVQTITPTQWLHNMDLDYQMKLKHIQVTELLLNSDSSNTNATQNLEVSFNFDVKFVEYDAFTFLINFYFILENKEEQFLLKVKLIAFFEVDKAIDNDFKDSDFVRINAPAIAFPYLRTFISNLTLNSGYNPVILPSFNFLKIAESKQ